MACGNAITIADAAQLRATAAVETAAIPARLAPRAANVEALMALHVPDASAPIDYDGAHAEALKSDGTIAHDRFGQSIELQWSEQYSAAQQARGESPALTRITCGSFTYLFDQSTSRPVGAYGVVTPASAPRDAASMAKLPPARDPRFERSERGHIIGHKLGGATAPFAVFDQSATMNRGARSRWRELERQLERSPGTFVAVRLVYQDPHERRPATIEFVTADGVNVEHTVFSNAPQLFASRDPD